MELSGVPQLEIGPFEPLVFIKDARDPVLSALQVPPKPSKDLCSSRRQAWCSQLWVASRAEVFGQERRPLGLNSGLEPCRTSCSRAFRSSFFEVLTYEANFFCFDLAQGIVSYERLPLRERRPGLKPPRARVVWRSVRVKNLLAHPARKQRYLLLACKANWRRAVKLLRGLHSMQLELHVLGYTAAMRCCDAAEQWPMAVALAMEMELQGIRREP